MKGTIITLITTLLLLAPTGCGREELSGPPELRMGRDECAWCGMLIGEDRCAAGALVERRGRREHLLFDDLACLVDFELEPDDETRMIERFVRDYEARTWLGADTALFLIADRDRLRTPMGSGMVAFAEREEAEQARAEFGGRVAQASELPALRKDRRAARGP